MLNEFFDIESGEIVTLADLAKEYRERDMNEYGHVTFAEYVWLCTTHQNGTLMPVYKAIELGYKKGE